MSEVASPLPILDDVCPVFSYSVSARDGISSAGVFRKPPGRGPFPTVVLLHGGLDPLPLSTLAVLARRAWTAIRLLRAGYLIVLPTRRERPGKKAQLQGTAPSTAQRQAVEDGVIEAGTATDGAVEDTLAWIRATKQMPEVDDASLVLLGSSGGSDLAFEVAGEARPAAIFAEEPATVLLTGILNENTPKQGEQFAPSEAWPEDLSSHYTQQLQQRTRAILSRVSCPVLVSQGDQLIPGADQLRPIREILLPELESLGKPVSQTVYPGQSHGFGFVVGAAPGPVSELTRAQAERFFLDADTFFRRSVVTQPRRWAA